LPLTALCDRSSSSVPKIQSGKYIDYSILTKRNRVRN
jgi:hypothetical protein